MIETNGPTPIHWCGSCDDYGIIELFHPSTDGLIGHRKCEWCPPIVKGVYYKPFRTFEKLWKRTPEELVELAKCPF